jgi:hypothetical protein
VEHWEHLVGGVHLCEPRCGVEWKLSSGSAQELPFNLALDSTRLKLSGVGVGWVPAFRDLTMAYRNIISLAAATGLALLATPQQGVAKPSALEAPLGIQSLMLCCVLFDAACMKAPADALQPSEATAVTSPQVAPGSGGALYDPETTGSVARR